MEIRKDVQGCSNLLKKADCVLIGAGAGLSVDAGIDVFDQASFARDYPGMVKQGFKMGAELIGYTGWSPELQWGYFAAEANEVRFQNSSQPVYGRLLDLVRNKDYFVSTSNVDAFFVRNGFAQDRVFTPQGDFALMQCQTPCSDETWPTKPIIDRILPTVDPATQMVTDPGVIPHCPNCGGPVMLNVRGGHWFVEEPYKEQAQRFNEWLQGTKDSQLLVIEIGAGFNTPGVIRWPMERIVYTHSNAHLVRVNLQYPQVPQEIADRSFSLQCRAMNFVNSVWGMN